MESFEEGESQLSVKPRKLAFEEVRESEGRLKGGREDEKGRVGRGGAKKITPPHKEPSILVFQSSI